MALTNALNCLDLKSILDYRDDLGYQNVSRHHSKKQQTRAFCNHCELHCELPLVLNSLLGYSSSRSFLGCGQGIDRCRLLYTFCSLSAGIGTRFYLQGKKKEKEYVMYIRLLVLGIQLKQTDI